MVRRFELCRLYPLHKRHRMNRFFTLLLAASCLTAFGQTEYPYPYNPDGNNDGYISLNDLLDLLSVYGSEFNAGVLATDSISAVYYTGELDYYDCASSCVALHGNWKMLDKDLVGSYKASMSNQTSSAWLDVRNAPLRYYGGDALGSVVYTSNWQTTGSQTQQLNGCFCQTRTRADIEDINVCEGLEDECGVCNGEGSIYECGCSDIPEGDCDCEGNQLDAIGVCGGECLEDVDGDGVCDPVLGPCEGQAFVTYHDHDYEIVETADGRCWFAEDLKTSKNTEGVSISHNPFNGPYPPGPTTASPNSDWGSHEDFVESSYRIYLGDYLYNAACFIEPNALCPAGWSIPSIEEWNVLFESYPTSQDFLQLVDSSVPNSDLILPYPTNGSVLKLGSTLYSYYESLYPNDNTLYYWTSDRSNQDMHMRMYLNYIGSQPDFYFYPFANENYIAVRCIKD